MWVSHFPRLSVFSPYSRSYSVCVSFCRIFSVSRHIPGPNIWVSHFSFWSVFSPFSRFYSVCFSFSTFSVFLDIFQVLSYEFLIFFFRFPVLSPSSRSYSVHFSFSTFFSVSLHISNPTMCVSHFPLFSAFCFAMFQVLQCSFHIFNFFQCFST